jgi:Zn-dependent metalloprotease
MVFFFILESGMIRIFKKIFTQSIFALCFLAACIPAYAVIENPNRGEDPRWIDPPEWNIRSESMLAGEPTAAGIAAMALLTRHGGTWEFSVDPRTGLAVMVKGSGIPLVPGRGNSLSNEVLSGLPMPDGEITLETLEPLMRAFLEENRDLVLPASGRLDLDIESSSIREDGRLASLYFRWMIDNIPVEGAHVFVRLNSGNITQFGAPVLGGITVNTVSSIDRNEAIKLLLKWSGDEETARLQDEPELVLQPENIGDEILTYRLVWVMRYKIPGKIETWEGRLDARNGKVIGFRDINRYGRVTGGVYERTVVDPEISAAFSHSDVLLDSGTATTDLGGFFNYNGGKAASGLDGKYFNTSCQDGCSNPSQASVNVEVGAGLIDFGFGGVDEIGNSLSTKAERNAYWHANRIRRIAKNWLPGTSWLDNNITINVNIDNTCNAVWNGAANFYRSGGGCNNTGEISDVVHHEWGHGVDGNTHSGDGATGEGTGDTASFHMSHDPEIGPYFRTDGSPVRNMDKNQTSKGLLTRSNVNSKCPSGSGPLGAEVHCEGEIYGQTGWDLAQALVAKHGYHTGWRTSERIFFTSLPDAGSYLPEQTDPMYDAYLNADDDDGNLANGTPNGQEIYDAFNTHEIAGSPASSSAPCTRPSEVIVSAVADCDQINLSWDAVSGADHYEVLRAEVRLTAPFFSLGIVPSTQTSFLDTEVAPGMDYWYSVMAVAADGCESTIESPIYAKLDDQPILSAVEVIADDTPRGNRSGFADPGEEVDLTVTLQNYGTVDAGMISGTLTSPTPGVTILEGFDTWPAITVGAAAENEAALRFVTDELQVECGQTMQFQLVPDESSGCSDDNSYFGVKLGTSQSEYAQDFETDDGGWSLDVINSTASAGDWTYGNPDGTSYQPEDDVTADPGVNCWFTAPNAGGTGTDDVDDGVTILVSNSLDLSSLDRAILSYYRWFANRDTGEDAGDFFKVDVSSNDGATWVNLETLGTNESAASWNRLEFDLENFITLTNQVRIRFQASDGPATGNLIEAAIDEIHITQPICDDTPACFVEPDFDGLQTADPGGSCAETALSWQPASSNCINANITYNIYRSTIAGFIPGDTNLIASGLTGTTFEDSLLDPGVTYYYITRAYDSRSGEDANMVERSVVAPAAPDSKSPIFAGLESALSGGSCGETVLSWSTASETCSTPVSYEIYRSTDPGFVPSPSNRIGSSLSLLFVDAALIPGQSYTYVVRALDSAGNEDGNNARLTVVATILDLTLLERTFEPDGAGWSVVAPNDATAGNWEHGDPIGTSYQPEDDHTPDPGINAWVTGITAEPDNGDVDSGTTTLLSALYDLSSTVDPAVRYYRWFTNDRGNAPGEDPLVVEISNDDGANWSPLEEVSAGTPLAWVEVEIPIPGTVTPTANMRFRFTASDLGDGSLVEAAIDDFSLIDRDQGCGGCSIPVDTVGTIHLNRSGDDVVLDWTADPVEATRFVIYKLTGPDFSESVRIGSTDQRTFAHVGAAMANESFYYRVTAVDSCGNESSLQ